MPDVLVRDVKPSVLESLKKRAVHNGRSLQAELEVILEQVVKRPLVSASLPQFNNEKIIESRKLAAKIRRSLEGRQHTDSVELIREDRR
ncbi:MAG: FitA-like ribbon-helix-helix domain-containing protein, partial [Pyrinomonadaceae bacterium]